MEIELSPNKGKVKKRRPKNKSSAHAPRVLGARVVAQEFPSVRSVGRVELRVVGGAKRNNRK